jgi:hypothetical protein
MTWLFEFIKMALRLIPALLLLVAILPHIQQIFETIALALPVL